MSSKRNDLLTYGGRTWRSSPSDELMPDLVPTPGWAYAFVDFRCVVAVVAAAMARE